MAADQARLYKLIVIYKTQSYRNAGPDGLVSEFYLRKKCMSFITGTSASDAFSKTRYQHGLLELDNRLKVELHTEKMR
ncbi:GL10481 [Drosophila persimilis]|uniref:GL10481 n=1 Tax=Drosophila persimilis TaxID=7234 RepID=B4GC03_DROPE|nr:GL10481 [Drosophila persimilis]